MDFTRWMVAIWDKKWILRAGWSPSEAKNEFYTLDGHHLRQKMDFTRWLVAIWDKKWILYAEWPSSGEELQPAPPSGKTVCITTGMKIITSVPWGQHMKPIGITGGKIQSGYSTELQGMPRETSLLPWQYCIITLLSAPKLFGEGGDRISRAITKTTKK